MQWFWTLIIVSHWQCQASQGGIEDTQETVDKQKPQDSEFGSFCKFLFPLSNEILWTSVLFLRALTTPDHGTEAIFFSPSKFIYHSCVF